ncbi:hypothetical protein RJ640_024451 [Escallonia rubra]|uniref:Uncharacterized protein n=1 Tax=Escallonia rubra TaxID=112253 RepID=A0AA88S712_9ASTE|nr:hypothetical protein RJ640_024451 [Escallonia rubra]
MARHRCFPRGPDVAVTVMGSPDTYSSGGDGSRRGGSDDAYVVHVDPLVRLSHHKKVQASPCHSIRISMVLAIPNFLFVKEVMKLNSGDEGSLMKLFSARLRSSRSPRLPRSSSYPFLRKGPETMMTHDRLALKPQTAVKRENVGLLGSTRVGSRRVIQISAGFMIFFSILASVGLSFLQFTNMNSMRNLFIIGVSFYLGLSIPEYFREYTALHGPAHTNAGCFNDFLNTIFLSSPTVALIVAVFLDNTLEFKDSARDRGMPWWAKFRTFKGDSRNEDYVGKARFEIHEAIRQRTRFEGKQYFLAEKGKLMAIYLRRKVSKRHKFTGCEEIFLCHQIRIKTSQGMHP